MEIRPQAPKTECPRTLGRRVWELVEKGTYKAEMAAVTVQDRFADAPGPLRLIAGGAAVAALVTGMTNEIAAGYAYCLDR